MIPLRKGFGVLDELVTIMVVLVCLVAGGVADLLILVASIWLPAPWPIYVAVPIVFGLGGWLGCRFAGRAP